jgi:hypothetical protein
VSTNTLRNTEHKDLAETWRCEQAARIVQRSEQSPPHNGIAMPLFSHELCATFSAIVVLGMALFRDRPAVNSQVDVRLDCHGRVDQVPAVHARFCSCHAVEKLVTFIASRDHATPRVFLPTDNLPFTHV